MTPLRTLSLLSFLAFVLGSVPIRDAAAQSHPRPAPGGLVVPGGQGSVGVLVEGGGTAFAGTFGPDGPEGIVVGPDGTVRHWSPTSRDEDSRAEDALAGELDRAGGAIGVLVGPDARERFTQSWGPAGFDPFTFAFGPAGRPAPGGLFFHGGDPFGADLSSAGRAFRSGDLRGALGIADEAARLWPDDPEITQLRALNLFALGRFPEAGTALRAALAVTEGWDWDRIQALYDVPEDYLRQYRSLQEAATADPGDAAIQFLLAYHDRLLGRPEASRSALQRVLDLQPGDRLARDLLRSLPPSPEPRSVDDPRP